MVPATLPAALVTSPRSISTVSPTTAALAGFSPQVIANPTNPSHLVEVHSGTNGRLVASYSTNGGQTWTGFINTVATAGSPTELLNIADPNLVNFGNRLNNPLPAFTVVTNATAAWDRQGNLYITAIQRDATNNSGALVLQKYNMTGTPTRTITNLVLERWLGTDPILNPVVAVDNNLPTFTDPTTGAVQTDTMAGHAIPPVYVAWNTNHTAPAGSNATFNPNVIKVVSSADGGAKFTTPVFVNDGGNTTSLVAPERFSAPQIVFTQGSADGRVAGGLLTFVWNDFGNSRVQLDASHPDGQNVNTKVADAYTFTAGSQLGMSNANVASGGDGYTVGDLLAIQGGTGISALVRVTAISGLGATGPVTAIALVQAGTYSVFPGPNPVGVTGGTGSGATLTVFSTQMSFLSAANITAGQGGTGYAIGDIVTLAGGLPAQTTPVPTVAKVQVTAINIAVASGTVNNGGTGYVNGQTLTVQGGGGTNPAQFVVTVGAGGTITGLTLVAPGGSYPSTNTPGAVANLTGGSGSGARVNLVYASTGTVTAVTVVQPGSYSNTPGFGNVVTVGVTAAVPTNPAGVGSGYVVGDLLTVNGGTGTAAQLQVTTIGAGGEITGVSVVPTASGAYTAEPPVLVSVTNGPGVTGTGAPTFNLTYSSTGVTVTGTPAITTAGTGYLVGDIITVTGTSGTPAQYRVATIDGVGGILTLATIYAGSYTNGGQPANPFNVTTGTGTGAQLTLTYQPTATGLQIFFPNFTSSSGTGPIRDAQPNATSGQPDVAGVVSYSIPVGITDPNFVVGDVDVTVAITHPRLSNLRVVLVSPNGTRINLINNRIDGAGNTIGGTPGLPDASNTLGIGVVNVDINNNYSTQIGTVFDQDAPRRINDGTAVAPYTAHFRPEGGGLNGLSIFNGLVGGSTNLVGNWSLELTDTKNDTTTAPFPLQRLDAWSIHFTSQDIDTTGAVRFGTDRVVSSLTTDPVTGVTTSAPLTTIASAATAPYPLAGTGAYGAQGVGAKLSVAVDNTLGSFSPYQGRVYIGYTGGGGTDTNVFLASFDGLSTTTTPDVGFPVRVNDDSPDDNFSEGNRPQFSPTVAVDQATGTVGVMYFDARWDPARARAATSFTTSIDGGETFAPSTFLSTPRNVRDAVTGTTYFLEPLPGNQAQAAAINGTTFNPGFGDRQGLVMHGGRVVPVFASNDNAAGTVIKTAAVTVSAGPRIISGTMGPVSGNTTADGTPRLTNFVITFDRPVDPATFSGDDVRLEYRNTVTPAGTPPNLVLTGIGQLNVTPLNQGSFFGPGLTFGNPMATSFVVSLVTPLSGVGTYSYSIGSNISDRIRSFSSGGGVFTATGPANTNLRVPPTDTGGTLGGIVWPTLPALTNEDTTASSIVVNGLTAPLTDVNVNVRMTHTFTGDLSLRLVAPNGMSVILASLEDGGTDDGYANTTFDDSAPVSVTTATPPYGFVQPRFSLSAFNGMLPGVANGTWVLQVNDAAGADIGILQGWSLDFTPAPVVTVRNGNFVDQDQDTITNEPAGSGTAIGDVFAIPRPISGGPFQLPYAADTLPLIITGPGVASTTVPGAVGADNRVLNGTNNTLDVTFDRNMDPTSFTTANILRIVGPTGPITSYTQGPTVVFSGGLDSATGTPRLLGGALIGITITNPGTFYLTAPRIEITGGGGTGATAVATITGGRVTGITITNGGSGYTSGPTITFLDGQDAATGIATVVGGVITGVAITNPGSHYISAPTVSFVGGGGTAAAATATIANGQVTGATVTSGGRLYTTTVPKTIPDGGTLNAPLRIVDSLMVNDLAVGVNITHPDTSELNVTLIAPDGTQVPLFAGLAGTSLTNTVFDHFSANLLYNGGPGYTGTFRPLQAVTTAAITNVGSGYTVGDVLTVIGGTNNVAAQIRVTGVNASGGITAVTVVNGGGYFAQPVNPVFVTGGSGTGARFTLSYTNPLSALNGKNYLGVWTLRITDTVANGSVAQLNSWTINPFTVTANPPGGSPNRTFRVTFPTQSRSGTYSLLFGPDAAGNYVQDQHITAAAIVAAGSGYSVGNILTVQGGTFSSSAQIRVTSIGAGGAITGVQIQTPGAYTILPAAPATVTGGSGTGATFNLTQGNKLDVNDNAGLDLLRGGDPNNGTLLPVINGTGPVNVAIQPGRSLDSVINVPQSFLVQGVTLQLSIQHQNIPDLTATLISPDGHAVQLFTNIGNTGVTPRANMTNTVLDDFAPSLIEDAPILGGGVGIGAGPFKPQFPISDDNTGFKNRNSVGNWTLRITSRSASITGTLVDWTLTLQNSIAGSGLGEAVADRFSASFRIFTQEPTNQVSQQSWTAVGPAAIQSQSSTGRVGGIAVDPSDPSGNTVYAGGASGGIWKTSDFLNPNRQPTWVPLTDFGPGNSLNTGSIAVFGRNNDPNQSIIFVATGEGDTFSSGIGFLRSMDGGRTWNVLDGVTNAVNAANAQAGETIGTILPVNDPRRDHGFLGSTTFKVIVDPTAQPDGNVIVYAAVSGANGGVWRSKDSGGTWVRLRAGNADDVVLGAGSAGANGNLVHLYGAFRGQGVYWTGNATGASSMQLLNGGQGMNTRRDMNPPLPAMNDIPIPVNNPGVNPNGALGRIVLATPAKTGNALEDDIYQGWLYAAVVTPGGRLHGVFQTKDFGLNWTELHFPVDPPPTGANIPTNNDSLPNDYDVFGNSLFAQGNYDAAITIDPNNPNVIFIGGLGGGGSNGQKWAVIRIDSTLTNDAHALVGYDNSQTGGQIQTGTLGGVDVRGPNYGLVGNAGPYINMLRDPVQPFRRNASLRFTDAVSFTNNGNNTRWRGITSGQDGGDYHEILAIRDPLTGETRLIYGNDHVVATGMADRNGAEVTGIGTASSVIGTRNGNLQTTQLYYGAVQPSKLAADIAGVMFYGMAQDDGFPKSSSRVLLDGNIDWGGPDFGKPGNGLGRGDGAGVATDQTGSGSSYEYRWPCCINDGSLNSDFFKFISPSTGYVSRTTGLLQPGDDPANQTGQWPYLGTINFAVNPIDPSAIVMSSSVGRIFLTSGPSTGFGIRWFPIADPGDLGGGQSLAMAFGAPANATAPLSDFIYVGTSGRMFVTFTGGGVGPYTGGASPWREVSTGLSGRVMAISPNPERGSREVYAVTTNGVFWLQDSLTSTAWVPVTGNLFSATTTRSLFNDPAQQLATLRPGSLSSIQADWRYAIPDDLANPTGPKHPVLYVGGVGGVFRSLDKGVTWTYFPDIGIDGAIQNGGLLPSAEISDLDMALGDINPLNGRPDERYGLNLLVATTYGRGTFAIRLSDQIKLSNGDPLYKYAITATPGPHVVSVTQNRSGNSLVGLTITFSGPVDSDTFTRSDILGLTAPDGTAITVSSISNLTGGGTNGVFRLNFASQTQAGLYRLSFGPGVSDYSGNQMDQDQDVINGEQPDDIFNARLLFQPFTNSAPILNVTSANVLPDILEDALTPSITGMSVTDFLAGLTPPGITDPNNTNPPPNGYAPLVAPRGIAITGVDNTNGRWQYSLDSGITWLDLATTTGGPTDFEARLLDQSTSRIRFVPLPDFFGTATFTFRAWDLTSGLNIFNGSDGGTADVSVNDGTTAFSATTATASITVIGVNDAPTFTAGPNVTVPEDNNGTGVTTIPGWGVFNAGPPNESSQTATLVIQSSTGTAGLLVGVNPFTINANGDLTFTTAANASGSATFTVIAQDNGGTANGGVDTSSPPRTFTITVTAVNDPPVPGPDTLANVVEDAAPFTIPFTTLLSNDTNGGGADENGQILTLIGVGNAVGGTVQIVGSAVRFTPTANFNGPARFEYTVNDSGSPIQSAIGTVTFLITEVNDLPVPANDSLPSIAEDAPAFDIPFATLTTNDNRGAPNESAQTLTVFAVSNAVGGTVSIVGSNVHFVPNPNFNGTASFQYSVQDNGTTAGVNDFKTSTVLATVTFLITEVNDLPVPANDSLPSIAEDAPAFDIPFATLTTNDNRGAPNESAQTLTVISVGSAVGGTVSIVGSNVHFVPDPDFFGTASFQYTVRDNGTTNGIADPLDSSTFATATFTITEVNDAPTAADDTLPAIGEDSGPYDIPGATLTGNDSVTPPANEATQTLTVTAVSNPIGGTVSVVGNVVTFTPTLNYHGPAGFTYEVSDNGTTNGAADPRPATATVTFAITDVNDPPASVDDTLANVAEDSGPFTVTVGDLAANDSPGPANESSQTFTITAVGNAVGGMVSLNPITGVVTFTPDPDFFGPASFEYTATDDGTTGGNPDPRSSTATARFTITEENDEPVPANDTLSNVAEDPSPVVFIDIPFASLTVNDSRGAANESAQTLTIVSVGNAVGGTVTIVGTAVRFTPTLNYNGPAGFTYTVTDNGTTNGAADPLTSSTSATVTFNLSEVNDAPVPTNDTLSNVAEDSAAFDIPFGTLTGNDSAGPPDESTQTLTITAVSNAIGGTVTIIGTDVHFEPATNFNGTASFQYTVTDNGTTNGVSDPMSSTGTVTFTITEENDEPVPANDTLSNVAEDPSPVVFIDIPFASLTVNDSRGAANESAQTLTIVSVGNAVGGTVTIVGTAVRFTPTLNYNGPAGFTYTVTDNGTTNGAADPLTSSTSATVTFTITEVNDAPTALDDALVSILEDALPLTIPGGSLSGNDSAGPANESGQTLTVTGVSNPVGGTVSVTGNVVTFTPTPNYNGPAGFTYTVTDNGTTNGATNPRTATANVTFTITAVNDRPSFVVGPNQATPAGGSLRTVADFATGFNPGAANESTQTVAAYIVSNDNNALFSVQPSITPDGTLTYQPAPGMIGSATVTVQVQDNSGTANGGVDTSTAQTFRITVGRVTTTKAASTFLRPVTGQRFSLVATVKRVGRPGPLPTGTVTFKDGPTTLGTAPLLSNGKARLLLPSGLNRAVHTITAEYNGDTVYLPSQGRFNQKVFQAKTATRLATSSPVVVEGSPATFTATVRALAPGAGVPTGNVRFAINGVISAPVMVDGNGRATFTTSGLTPGKKNVMAFYDGDPNYRASRTPIALVQRVTALVRLQATLIQQGGFNSDNPFSVYVAAVNSSNQVISTFTGTVSLTLLDAPAGGTISGPVTVSFVNGVARFNNLHVNRQGKYVLQFTSNGGLVTTLTLDDTGRQT